MPESMGLWLNIAIPAGAPSQRFDRNEKAAREGTARRQPESSLVFAVSLRWNDPVQVRRVCSQAGLTRPTTPNDAPPSLRGQEQNAGGGGGAQGGFSGIHPN